MWYLNTQRERSHTPLTRCAPHEAELGVLLLTMEKVTRSPFARTHGVELCRELAREKAVLVVRDQRLRRDELGHG